MSLVPHRMQDLKQARNVTRRQKKPQLSVLPSLRLTMFDMAESIGRSVRLQALKNSSIPINGALRDSLAATEVVTYNATLAAFEA